jgi:hypothetical protein
VTLEYHPAQGVWHKGFGGQALGYNREAQGVRTSKSGSLK